MMFSNSTGGKSDNLLPLLPEHDAGELDLLPMGTKVYPSAYAWSPKLRGIALVVGALSFVLFIAACATHALIAVLLTIVAM
jgi:hypothetical protein